MRHLITGAGSGIGRLLADRLHDRGDDLILLARTDQRAAEFEERWSGCSTVVADLADAASWERVELLDRLLGGGLDSLCHVAGVVELGRVADLAAADWAETLSVNLVAPAALTRLALPALRAGRGTVVFVNSGAGLHAHAQWSAYAASKFGLRALADALRAEEQDIRVSSIFPGRTATPMQAKVHEQESRDYDPAAWIRPETVVEAIRSVIDLGPDATLTEVTVRPSA